MKKKFTNMMLLVACMLTLLLTTGCSFSLSLNISSPEQVESESHKDNPPIKESVSDADVPSQTLATSDADAPAQTPDVSDMQTPQATDSDSTLPPYHFRTKSLLDDHYEKHGIEMGFESAEDYERAASKVVQNPKALHKTEKEDGDDVYYVEETNEFVIVSIYGYIRTYFNPSRGKAYFDAQ